MKVFVNIGQRQVNGLYLNNEIEYWEDLMDSEHLYGKDFKYIYMKIYCF